MKIALIIVVLFLVAIFFAIFPSFNTTMNGFTNMTVHNVTNNMTGYYTASNSTQVYSSPELMDFLGSNLWLIGLIIGFTWLFKFVYDYFKGDAQ